MKRILFVCSRNRRRSPTGEAIFSERPNWEVASAGLSPDAEEMLTAETVEWADVIFVMEKRHRAKLTQRFSAQLKSKRLICLDIPDNFEYLQPELVTLLETKVRAILPEF